MVLSPQIEPFIELPKVMYDQVSLIIEEIEILKEKMQSLQVDMDQVVRKVRDVERQKDYFKNKINEEMGF